MFNRYIRGWVNYYGRYHPSALHRTFDCINRRLVRWAMKKYKRYRGHQRRATQWLRRIARKRPGVVRALGDSASCRKATG